MAFFSEQSSCHLCIWMKFPFYNPVAKKLTDEYFISVVVFFQTMKKFKGWWGCGSSLHFRFCPPDFFSNITPPNILFHCQLWDFVSLPEKCSSMLHLLKVLPELFAPSIGDSTIDLAVLALEVRLSNWEVLLVIRCCSCSSSLSGSYDFTFFSTTASFFQNPIFADALAAVVLLVQHAGKVKEKKIIFFCCSVWSAICRSMITRYDLFSSENVGEIWKAFPLTVPYCHWFQYSSISTYKFLRRLKVKQALEGFGAWALFFCICCLSCACQNLLLTQVLVQMGYVVMHSLPFVFHLKVLVSHA